MVGERACVDKRVNIDREALFLFFKFGATKRVLKFVTPSYLVTWCFQAARGVGC